MAQNGNHFSHLYPINDVPKSAFPPYLCLWVQYGWKFAFQRFNSNLTPKKTKKKTRKEKKGLWHKKRKYHNKKRQRAETGKNKAQFIYNVNPTWLMNLWLFFISRIFSSAASALTCDVGNLIFSFTPSYTQRIWHLLVSEGVLLTCVWEPSWQCSMGLACLHVSYLYLAILLHFLLIQLNFLWLVWSD